MDQSRTVVEAKTAFLRQQIRLLSATLQPSSQWRDNAPAIEEPELSDKVVEDVMNKVNAKIKQHNRLVYSAASTRHVAEQIDVLYWNSVSEGGIGSAETDFESGLLPVKKTTDLTDEESLSSLPSNLEQLIPADSSSSQPYTPSDSAAYSTALTRLSSLHARHTAIQNKLNQLKALKALLEPYKEPQKNIQPNLVTRNGDLGKELDRMRVLIARVTAAVAAKQQANENGANGEGRDGDLDVGMSGDVEVNSYPPNADHTFSSEEEKLSRILDMT